MHAEGFSTSSYQLTSLADIPTGKIEGRTVGEGTAGVFTGGMVVRLPGWLLHCGSARCTVMQTGT